MARSLLALCALVAPTAILIACGSGGSSSTSSGSGGSTSTTSSHASSSSTGTSTSTSTTSTSSSGTGGGAPVNACTDAADLAIENSLDVAGITGTCGTNAMGAEPATKNCIKMKTMLSDNCVTCYDNTVQCVVAHCIAMCIGGPSPACDSCRKTNCDPAFFMCSGLPMPMGDAGGGG